MGIAKLPILILIAGVSLASDVVAGGNHCDAIRKNKIKCDELEGPKLEEVKARCEDLLKAQEKARSLAKSSCGQEADSTKNKANCSLNDRQKDFDTCTSAADKTLHNNAAEAAANQRNAVSEVKDARKKLDEEIQKVDGDPEVDQTKLTKAKKVCKESENGIESDITMLAQQDEQAAGSFGDTGQQLSDNATGLGTADPSGGASVADAGASGSDVAASGADAAASGAGAAASGASMSSSAANSGGTGSVAAYAVPSNSASPANMAATGTSPTNVGSLGSAASAPAASVPNASGAPMAVASASSGAPSAAAMAPASSSAPLTVLGASVAQPSSAASSPAAAAAGPSLRETLRNSLLAAASNGASAEASSSARGSALAAGESVPQGANGSGGRNLASDSSPESAAAATTDGLEPFGNELRGPRFSLMSSDTDVAVKKLVGELAAAAGSSPSQESTAEIGERNGPSLFARSHATIERSLRLGQVRGMAAR